MSKTLREQLEIVRQEGLQVVSVERGRHWKVRVQTPCGRMGVLTLSYTPSDRRTSLNLRADARRLLRNVATLGAVAA